MSTHEERFTIQGGDEEAIVVFAWRPPAAVRGALVVAHGLGEHARRYRAGLAEVIKAGWIVYAPDHRGHGETSGPGRRGDFGPGGFGAVVDDLNALVRRVRDTHPDVPLVVLGHSMGSLVAQLFVVDHADSIDGLALSGSAAFDVLIASIASQPTLGGLNAAFEPARTPFDWLSTDAAQVDLYIADPACGFDLNEASMMSMAMAAARTADDAALAAIPRELPVYLFSGTDDPLELTHHALTPLIARWRARVADLTVDLYAGKRHELLNETNRGEVVASLLRWLDRVPRRAA